MSVAVAPAAASPSKRVNFSAAADDPAAARRFAVARSSIENEEAFERGCCVNESLFALGQLRTTCADRANVMRRCPVTLIAELRMRNMLSVALQRFRTLFPHGVAHLSPQIVYERVLTHSTIDTILADDDPTSVAMPAGGRLALASCPLDTLPFLHMLLSVKATKAFWAASPELISEVRRRVSLIGERPGTGTAFATGAVTVRRAPPPPGFETCFVAYDMALPPLPDEHDDDVFPVIRSGDPVSAAIFTLRCAMHIQRIVPAFIATHAAFHAQMQKIEQRVRGAADAQAAAEVLPAYLFTDLRLDDDDGTTTASDACACSPARVAYPASNSNGGTASGMSSFAASERSAGGGDVSDPAMRLESGVTAAARMSSLYSASQSADSTDFEDGGKAAASDAARPPKAPKSTSSASSADSVAAAGNFIVRHEKIGSGASGVVYSATCAATGRFVALKELHIRDMARGKTGASAKTKSASNTTVPAKNAAVGGGGGSAAPARPAATLSEQFSEVNRSFLSTANDLSVGASVVSADDSGLTSAAALAVAAAAPSDGGDASINSGGHIALSCAGAADQLQMDADGGDDSASTTSGGAGSEASDLGVKAVTEEEQRVVDEITIMKRLRHENIIAIYGTRWCRIYGVVYICMELARSSLRQLIERTAKHLPLRLCAVYVRGILSGLVYLHEHGIIHRDIKCANILLTDSGVVKVSDFGLSVSVAAEDDARDAMHESALEKSTATEAAAVGDGSVVASPAYSAAQLKRLKQLCGTPAFIAPELFAGALPSEQSDVWSFGCTMIELVCLSPWWNYASNTLFEVYGRLKRGEVPTLPDAAARPDLTPEFRDFVASCIQLDPCRRPTAQQLLQHPFVSSVSAVIA